MKVRTPKRGWAIVSALFIWSSLATAHAHQDRALELNADGAIVGLPKQYLPAQFLLNRDEKGRAVRASLKLSGGQYVFPKCMLRLFDKNPHSEILLGGSWYHEQIRLPQWTSLPYYIWLRFRDEDKRRPWESYELLFNLRTAQLLKVKKTTTVETEQGTSGTIEEVFTRVCPGKVMTDGWQRTSPRSGE